VLVLVIAALIWRQRSMARPETLAAILLAVELLILEIRRSGNRDHSAPFWNVNVSNGRDRGVTLTEVEDFRSVTGKGVQGTVGGRRVVLGNQALMETIGLSPGAQGARTDEMRCDGQSVMCLAVDGRLVGLLGVADPIKASTPEAIQALRREGLRIVMLTGDSRGTAEAVARRLGLDDVRAEILPDQKEEVVRRLQNEGRVVAMAGDGINDAPALARTHFGIAMGTGTDVCDRTRQAGGRDSPSSPSYWTRRLRLFQDHHSLPEGPVVARVGHADEVHARIQRPAVIVGSIPR
jgi:high-affinity K+ transport system ATPase subunit B